MKPFRKISFGTWDDERVRALSDDGKLLWFYLLTGRETTPLPGIFRVGRAQLAEDMGWPLEKLDAAFAELARDPAGKLAVGGDWGPRVELELGKAPEDRQLPMAMADWVAKVIWLPRALEHNTPDNPNVVLGWKGHWSALPECPFARFAYLLLREHVGARGEAFVEAFERAVPMPRGLRSNGLENRSDNGSGNRPENGLSRTHAGAPAVAPSSKLSDSGSPGQEGTVSPIPAREVRMTASVPLPELELDPELVALCETRCAPRPTRDDIHAWHTHRQATEARPRALEAWRADFVSWMLKKPQFQRRKAAARAPLFQGPARPGEYDCSAEEAFARIG